MSSVSVTIGPFVAAFVGNTLYQPWGLLAPLILAPGQNLVLAETTNFNFDSSDPVLAANPMVFGAVNNMAFGFTDVRRVLYGHEDAGNSTETTPYNLIGSVQVVPVPGVRNYRGGSGAALRNRARGRRHQLCPWFAQGQRGRGCFRRWRDSWLVAVPRSRRWCRVRPVLRDAGCGCRNAVRASPADHVAAGLGVSRAARHAKPHDAGGRARRAR